MRADPDRQEESEEVSGSGRSSSFEEEEKQMTLDEWKAKQAKKEGPKFNLRKAGEGSDVDPKWKKATIYKKENEEEDDEEEEEAVVYLQRSTRQKKLDINFTFADQGGRGGGDRGRGEGRGRGDGRPRGGGGKPRGEFSLDQEAFPTLG